MDEGPGFVFAVGDLNVVYLMRGGGCHFIGALIFRLLIIILQINMKMCLCFYRIIYFLEVLGYSRNS